MKISVRIHLALVLCAATLVISGCTKPLPSVTIQSGTQSVHTQALCWDEGNQNRFRDCLSKLATDPNLAGKSLGVSAGNSIGISIDPKATEFGWQALLGGNPLFTTPKTTTYYRFNLPALENQSSLQIVSFGPENSVRGVWLFEIAGN